MSATGIVNRPATVAERWHRLPRRWQAVLAVGAALVVASVVTHVAGGVLSNPSPPIVGPASSYDTGGAGTGAFAQLLRDRLHPVQQLSIPIKDASLPAGATLFVLDPASRLTGDVAAMRHVLVGGGRLVLGGRSAVTPSVLTALTTAGGGGGGGADGRAAGSANAAAPRWRPTPAGSAHPVISAPEVLGVSTVQTAPSGSFAVRPGTTRFRVLLEGPGGPFALIASVGSGTLVLLASPTPLQNASLGRVDDAAFGLDLAGTSTTSVAFDEYDHGAGRTSPGLSGLPGHWKIALVLGLVAVLVWLLAAARRFGPPELADRELIPPRVAHVHAMATLLAAGPEHRLAEGAAPLQLAARERLRRQVRAQPDASDAELARAASDEGVPADLVSALLRAPATADELVLLGRAAVAIDPHGRRADRPAPPARPQRPITDPDTEGHER